MNSSPMCLNCGLDLYPEDSYGDYCNRDCALEAQYQREVPLCLTCRGSGARGGDVCSTCGGSGHDEESVGWHDL